MSNKKSRKARKSTAAKQSQGSSQEDRMSSNGISSTFDDASAALKSAVNGVPASAIYWGLGALALGAVATGVYIYRDRLMALYEQAVEAMTSAGEESDIESEKRTPVRRSKSAMNQEAIEAH